MRRFCCTNFCRACVDDIYIRYNCFHDASELKAAMVKKQPHKIDIGAVFNLPPKDHLGVSAGSFKTVEVSVCCSHCVRVQNMSLHLGSRTQLRVDHPRTAP